MNKSLITTASAAIMAVSIHALPALPVQEAGGRLRTDQPTTATQNHAQSFANWTTAQRNSIPKTDVISNPSGATLQGFIGYDAEDKLPLGWYDITSTGDMNLLWAWSNDYISSGLYPRGGWMRNGRLCMHAVASLGGDQQLYGSLYMEFNPATGALLQTEVVDIYKNPYSNIIAPVYVESEDRVYGYSISSDGDDYSFSSAPANKLNEAKAIRQLNKAGERCYSIAYNQDEDCFYGINYFDKLVRISKDGSYEEICALPFSGVSGNIGGLIYSPYDGCYFYNPQFYEKPSAIYAIYPAEKKFVLLTQFEASKQIAFFYTPDNAPVSANAPKAPVVKSKEFTAGDNKAKVTYTLPSTTREGAALTGSVTWKACIDNNETASGSGTPGQDVPIDFTALDNGYRTLQLFVTADGKTPNPAVATVFSGYDAPAMPTNVKLTDTKVSWTRVRRGEHNEYFDGSDLVYEVCLNGKSIGSTSGTSLDIALDASKPMSAYTATVVAKSHGLNSKGGISNKIVYGKPYDLPMSFEPQASDIDLMSIYNLDGGAAYGEWCYSERWDLPCFSSGWSKDIDANDWLILPAAVFADASVAYSVSLDAACGGSSGKEEYIEVWAGNAPDPAAMTIPVIGRTQIHSMEWEKYSDIFGVPTAGTYYIGIHAVSKPWQYSLNVRNIKVEATELNVLAPESAIGLGVSATDDAQLTATVTFTLPGKYLTGEDIPAGSVIKATATTKAGSASGTGGPGESLSLTVPTQQGNNVIAVTCALDNAEGRTCEVMVFTGVDMPDFVENMRSQISEDNMAIAFTWEAPLKGLNDGYFVPTGIDYYVGEIDELGAFVGEPRYAGKDVFSYTYRLDNGTKLSQRRIAVAAGNAAGISNARWFALAVIGTPYTPPMTEGFDNMTFSYEPITLQNPSEEYLNSAWAWAQPELIDPAFDHGAGDFAVACYSSTGASKVRMALPKFTTSNFTEAMVTFDLWNGKDRASEVKVYGTTYGINPILLATIPQDEGWEEYDVVLPPALLNRPWVTVMLDATLPSENNYLVLSGYRVSGTSGIGTVEVNEDAPVEYYNLQGIRVENPVHGLYIRRQGSTATKVIL